MLYVMGWNCRFCFCGCIYGTCHCRTASATILYHRLLFGSPNNALLPLRRFPLSSVAGCCASFEFALVLRSACLIYFIASSIMALFVFCSLRTRQFNNPWHVSCGSSRRWTGSGKSLWGSNMIQWATAMSFRFDRALSMLACCSFAFLKSLDIAGGGGGRLAACSKCDRFCIFITPNLTLSK